MNIACSKSINETKTDYKVDSEDYVTTHKLNCIEATQ